MSQEQDYDLKCTMLDWACENLVGAHISKKKKGKYWLNGEVIDVRQIDAIKIDFKANDVLIWARDE